MTRQRIEWLILAITPVLGLYAILHLNAQVSGRLNAADSPAEFELAVPEIDVRNEPILREVENHGDFRRMLIHCASMWQSIRCARSR